jgi:nitroreductase
MEDYVLDTINSRQSVRAWLDKAIPASAIEKIVEAGMNAPSAGNQQAWHFVIVTDRELLGKMAAANPFGGYIGKAPCAILVCGDTRAEKYKGFWVQDCAAATENMLLAIHALKLGGVWTGIYPLADRVGKFARLAGLPAGVEPLALIPFGYPSTPLRKRPSRYIGERVHYNSW